MLPHRDTFNVVAEAGDPDAAETVVVVAHHDAAHSGLVFHPALTRLFAERFPALHERSSQTFPIMYATWLGPVLVALGSILGRARLLRAGSLLAAGAAAAMADIGASDVVPGANDNLSAVAVLVALARSLAERPTPGVRVLLLSTGSEESFMEGMQGFIRRHRADARSGRHHRAVPGVCRQPQRWRWSRPRACCGCAPTARPPASGWPTRPTAAGVELVRGLRTVAATDALIALRRGYGAATLASIDATKFPSNYHWPSDTPENLDWETIAARVRRRRSLPRPRRPAQLQLTGEPRIDALAGAGPHEHSGFLGTPWHGFGMRRLRRRSRLVGGRPFACRFKLQLTDPFVGREAAARVRGGRVLAAPRSFDFRRERRVGEQVAADAVVLRLRFAGPDQFAVAAHERQVTVELRRPGSRCAGTRFR